MYTAIYFTNTYVKTNKLRKDKQKINFLNKKKCVSCDQRFILKLYDGECQNNGWGFADIDLF